MDRGNSKSARMVKDEVLTVKDVAHKLLYSLIKGIKHEIQLSAAGSLISRSDYDDVVFERTVASKSDVTERTIPGMCGYPLCSNSLPSDRPWKGNYHISLTEHKVYYLGETYKYCSSSCLINSQAFAASLQKERSSNLSPMKLNEILKLFDGLSLESELDMGKNGDLGMSELKIQEKINTGTGEVSLEEWIGPSNAIDGYVPKKDHNIEPHQLNNLNKCAKEEQVEPKPRHAQSDLSDILCNNMKFTSTLILEDEYSISKNSPNLKAKESEGNLTVKRAKDQGNAMKNQATSSVNAQVTRSHNSNKDENATEKKAKLHIPEDASVASLIDPKGKASGGNEMCLKEESAAGSTSLKSSLKNLFSNRATHYVTWADEETDGTQNLCEYAELRDKKGAAVESSTGKDVSDESYRFVSVEACAMGLNQAAEAVASGKSDVSDALSEAGITILPPAHGVDEAKFQEYGGVMDTEDTEPELLKWPPKPGFSNADLLDSEDSWYESPPEGFSLALSPFSTMFMALFAWLSSSSLAYIYGRDESFNEDYLSVNGREYPCKIVLPDSRSSEIKQTLAGCLSRSLPGLVAELRLPTPISTLEQGLGRLIATMSFVDPLPAFRMKQWQVIILLFLDALSVSRIPALTQHMMGRRILLPKVLEGAQINAEEYEILKDLIIPLGRVPAFSSQSGG